MFYKALLRNLSWLGPALNILLLKLLCQYSLFRYDYIISIRSVCLQHMFIVEGIR